MIELLYIFGVIAFLTSFFSYAFKTILHFKYIRTKEGKSGNYSDYINVPFYKSIDKKKYTVSYLPFLITEKQEEHLLEKLRKKINIVLIISTFSMIFFMISMIIILLVTS